MNGVSAGVKKRDAQDFPCAGLRWMTPFVAGKNSLRVIAKKGAVTIHDETEFVYQTEKWDKPAELRLVAVGHGTKDGKPIITVEAKLYDAKGVLCLDAKNPVRFSIAGRGTLIDNLGTPQGSRLVQLYNGRAEVSLFPGEGKNAVAVVSEGIAPAILSLG